jgi:uncharacterized membrane protein
MIPIIALSIPVFAIIVGGLVKLQKAKLEALRMGSGADPALLAEVDELRHELGQVRAELGDVQERLDFTERLLTRGDREQPKA